MKNKEPAFLTLLLMISFAAANAVLVSPALPAIAIFFNVSSDAAQQVITLFLVGYALGQLLYGPLANRFGRKPTLYMGVALEIVSSFICILAGMLDYFPLLLLGRFTLALGAGVGLKMAFTILNECYKPKVVSQKVSYLMLAFAITPGISMAIGGFLTETFGWMSCFYASAIYGLLLVPLFIQLPETLKVLDLNALKFKHLLKAYIEQFRNIQLFAGGLLMGLTTCFIYVFAAIAPFVAINLLGMTSEAYGLANILPSIGYVIGAIISAKLAKKYSLPTIIRAGIGVVAIGIILMVLAAWAKASVMLLLFIPITIVYFGEALIYPAVSAMAMSTATDKSHASAVMNFLTIGLPTIAVLSFGLFTVTMMLLPIILVVLCVLIISIYGWFISVNRQEK
jgi:MFS family permease